MEITFSGTGKFKGVATTVTVTYWSIIRSDGVLSGEGKGMVMSRDGQEMATFTGQGIGRFVGSVFYHTASAGKVAFLNNLVAVFEHEVDESENVANKFWEWK